MLKTKRRARCKDLQTGAAAIFVYSAFYKGWGKPFDGAAQGGMANHKVNGRRAVFGDHCPLPFENKDLQIGECGRLQLSQRTVQVCGSKGFCVFKVFQIFLFCIGKVLLIKSTAEIEQVWSRTKHLLRKSGNFEAKSAPRKNLRGALFSAIGSFLIRRHIFITVIGKAVFKRHIRGEGINVFL